MTIENQCCSLEQAKRLKELGVYQLGYFIYGEKSKSLMESWTVDGAEDIFFVAFTVAELGEMLPAGYDTMKITTGKDEYAWNGFDLDGADFPGGTFDTEAQCRAAMLIHLIENKLITVQEINTRLMAG